MEYNLNLMNCNGEVLWGLAIFEFSINDIGQVQYVYETCTLAEDEDCYGIAAFTGTESNELLRKEDKYETLNGDKLEVDFKFKPMP